MVVDYDKKYRQPDLGPFDFIIYCAPRTGAHMLATMLQSHPDIACQGEVHLANDPVTRKGKKKAELHPVKKVGAIVHYRFEKIWAPLVIHLTRDPGKLALSQARIKEVRKYTKSPDRRYENFKAHHEKGTKAPKNSLVPVEPGTVEKIKSRVVVQMAHALKLLEKKLSLSEIYAVLPIRYEEITGDRSVEVMPEAQARRVLSFLGLEYCELTTYYRKGS